MNHEKKPERKTFKFIVYDMRTINYATYIGVSHMFNDAEDPYVIAGFDSEEEALALCNLINSGRQK